MPTCSDRQLLQSQLEQGFSTRIGVARAIRPFSGDPAPQNLVDYINRELFPAVKAGREKLNEVYLPAKEQAPSANPLAYNFSKSIVNADPTNGFLRLDAATQNTATTIRVSERNARLISTVAWLSVMAGSATSPLGVVTLQHQSDPGRFVRFNLTGMVDQGTYWDLAVTPVESSHPNPFTEQDTVQIGFIAGVASGGVSLASSIAAIRAVSAGTQMLTSGTLSFANGSGVSFGLNNGTLTASVNTAPQLGLLSHIGGNSVSNATRLAFSNANGVTFSLSTAAGAATLLGSVAAQTSLSFSNGSGVTFGIAGSTLTASVNDQSIGLVSHIGGNSVSAVTRLAFSNASNVTWSLSTAVGGATVIASVAPGGGGGETKTVSLATYPAGLSSSFSAATDSSFSGNPLVFQLAGTEGSLFSRANVLWRMSAGSMVGIAPVLFMADTVALSANAVSFNPGSGATFGVTSTADPLFGRVVLVTASVNPQLGLVSHIGGNSVGSATRLAFSNLNNVTWSLSTAAGAATVIGSYALRVSGGASTADVSNLVFTNTNNVGFALSTNAAGATLRAAASIQVSAGTTNGAQSVLSFGNANGVSFGLNGSTVTASVGEILGLVSHVGGNSVADVTRLAFSNASNVTWSLSTAASAVTVIASVDAGAGMGISAGTQSVSTGTLVFSNSNGISFGMSGSSRVTASYNPLVIGAVIGGAASMPVSSGTVSFMDGTSPFKVEPRADGLSIRFDYPEPIGGFCNNARINNTALLPFSGLHNRPQFFQPFDGGPNLVGFNSNFRFGNWAMMMSGNYGNNSSTVAGGGASFAYTLKMALYSIAGGATTGSVLSRIASNSRLMSTNASGSGPPSFGLGLRMINFLSSGWDNAGPLTRGQLFAAFMVSMHTTNDPRASLLCETRVIGSQYNGDFGAASGTGFRLNPFAGLYTTTTAAFPATLASSHLFTNGANLVCAGALPWVSVQPNMAAGFG